MRRIWGIYFYMTLIFFAIAIFIVNERFLYITGALTVFFVFVYTFLRMDKYRFRFLMLQVAILFFQLSLYNTMKFEEGINLVNVMYSVIKIGILIIPFLSYVRFFTNHYISPLDFFSRTIQATKDLYSFTDIKNYSIEFTEVATNIGKDLTRHNSLQYINFNSLNDDYITTAKENLGDDYLYFILSYTGSDASRLIGKFTKTNYNHISIAFDYDLRTTVSYNGGCNLFRPGLNHEMINYFNKTKDSNIMVYKLNIGTENKKKIFNKIVEINEIGNSYNILGLIVPYKHKDNIMYCSQFVYTILEEIDYNFFQRSYTIKPTDFIEKDYYRKMEFCYNIFFNKNK